MADNSPKEHKSISKKEARRIRMQIMSKTEISYLRRKEAAERIFPVFRFVILFGLGFVILYPLIYMISCTFRERGDMNDPTVMWIPRNFTLNVLKETLDAMGFPKTLITTLFLNVGCALVQVISCAVTGYGFARFKFRGQKLLFAVVIMMILVLTIQKLWHRQIFRESHRYYIYHVSPCTDGKRNTGRSYDTHIPTVFQGTATRIRGCGIHRRLRSFQNLCAGYGAQCCCGISHGIPFLCCMVLE